MSDLTPDLGLPDVEAFLHGLNVPVNCVLNKPLFKKMFQEHADLDARDKKALKDDVDKIRWLYTLKPSTINIASYSDDQRDYGEVAVLYVELNKAQHAERIGHLINRAIPYPVVILFCSSADNRVAVCLAEKRTNRADSDKWVIDELQLSPWVSLKAAPGVIYDYEQSDYEQAFLASLNVNGLPHGNFLQFYQALQDRVLALQCAAINGRFCLAAMNRPAVSEQELERLRTHQRESLQHYREIEQSIKKLRAQIKQAEFNQQVVLNTQIKQQEERLNLIADTL